MDCGERGARWGLSPGPEVQARDHLEAAAGGRPRGLGASRDPGGAPLQDQQELAAHPRACQAPEHHSLQVHYSITVITVTNLVLLSPPEVQRPAQGQCREGGRAHGRRQSHFRGVMRLMEQTRMGLAGYDPAEEDMRGVFMAKGPGERQQLQCHYSEALLDLFKQVITNFGVLAYFHN